MVHQPDKRHVVLRFNQQDVFDVAQDAVDRLADVRVKVYRIDNLHIVVLRGDFSQRVTDLLKAPTKAFATVASDQNGFFAVIQERIAGSEFFLQIAVCQHAIAYPNQRVNDRIAGHKDLVIGDIFTQQVLARVLGWRKVIHRQMPGKRTVGLFRPRRIKIAGAQTRFNMADGNTLVKRGQACCHRRRGIPVHQHDVGLE